MAKKNNDVDVEKSTTETIINETPKPYLILVDKETGERRTSYVIGVHGESMEELHALVDKEAEYKDCERIEDDGSIQRQLVDGSHLYVNGEVVEKPPYVPTVEEEQERKIKELDAKAEPIFTDLENQIMKAELVYQDSEQADELRAELKLAKEAYIKEREALANGK